MVRVFLSHSSQDKPFIRLFREDLVAAGVKAWLDELELGLGDSILAVLSAAIRDSDFFVVFLSRNSAESMWVTKELAVALERETEKGRVVVLPIRLDGSPIPDVIEPKLYATCTRATDYDATLRQVVKRIAPAVLSTEPFLSWPPLDEERKTRLIRAGQTAALREWVLDYLIGTLPSRQRHPERGRTYAALAAIGGERARAVIRTGLDEADLYPRNCAERAWSLIQ